MSDYSQIPVPLFWGSDELSLFMSTAYNNVFASFENKKNWYEKFLSIDGIYRSLGEIDYKFHEEVFTSLLCRSHGSFMVACQLAMAGQVVEGYMVLRGSLESALYALHAIVYPNAKKIWEEDDNKRRTEFSYGNVKKTFMEKKPMECNKMHSLYQDLINLGAHPNRRGIADHLVSSEINKNQVQNTLHVMCEPSKYDFSFEYILKTGVSNLRVIECAIPERMPSNFEEKINELLTIS